jgi:hypothetical protein
VGSSGSEGGEGRFLKISLKKNNKKKLASKSLSLKPIPGKAKK